MTTPSSRRDFFKTASIAGLGAGLSTAAMTGVARAQLPRSAAEADFTIKNGNIRQSIMGWCFKDHFDAIALAKHCKEIGLVGMEGIPREAYPDVKKMGFEISLVGSHKFSQGPCDPRYFDYAVSELETAINVAAEFGSKKVITFTGYRFDGMDEEKAYADCLKGWKKVLPLAESKGVTIVLEHLNSRDDTHPMKGHPGYFGDDVDLCFDMVRDIGSENFRLLFDIYHVSIMNGDVIRRIRQNHELIGHYHTAGNPGRGEIDDTQEINYPPIMREILKTGYEGYVAQEFIPTWDDPILALRHAAMTCDV
ncbi:MAG: TIM barrel protein [Verrucomicrobiae bacterium]|nr:TIM barrel protein [Verrucomicrobiae bacterium]